MFKIVDKQKKIFFGSNCIGTGTGTVGTYYTAGAGPTTTKNEHKVYGTGTARGKN